jgi:serine-type D-Ala-D-Ala carboxypeptidase/endopeptidase (penicillin-binding protein 4)
MIYQKDGLEYKKEFNTTPMKKYCLALFLSFLFCVNVHAQITDNALQDFLNDTTIRTGFAGVSVYEPATGKYWYNHNEDKSFVPASNMKLFSLYAGLKYLGDSLIGLRYKKEKNGITIYPTGDPTFLHPDFKKQNVFAFLKKQDNIQYATQKFCNYLGDGWAWNDYIDDYMAPRSEFPIYGNVISIAKTAKGIKITPKFIKTKPLQIVNQYTNNKDYPYFKNFDSNDLYFNSDKKVNPDKYTPLPLSIKYNEIPSYLEDTLGKKITFLNDNKLGKKNVDSLIVIHSQPADTLYKIMMSRSDNFFAEQTLLMASNELLGYMSNDKMIDTLLKTEFKDIPTKPKWTDGSGLSRYNLFSPKDFIFLLEKMKNEFGMERMTKILLTGNSGTLTGYYVKEQGFIYAKTGTISGVVALSGYLYTKTDKLLEFSILINNFMGTPRSARRAIEKFLVHVRNTN